MKFGARTAGKRIMARGEKPPRMPVSAVTFDSHRPAESYDRPGAHLRRAGRRTGIVSRKAEAALVPSSWAVIAAFIDQPTTRREKRSTTAAT